VPGPIDFVLWVMNNIDKKKKKRKGKREKKKEGKVTSANSAVALHCPSIFGRSQVIENTEEYKQRNKRKMKEGGKKGRRRKGKKNNAARRFFFPSFHRL